MEAADDRATGEIEVAHRVEHLVAHELVAIAQAAFVEDAVAADHDGVLERAAERQPGRAHALDLVEEAEGPGAANVPLEARRRGDDLDALAADRVRGEIDGEAQREFLGGLERRCGLARFHPDGLQDSDRAPRRVLLNEAGALDEMDEWRGAAIHRRNFGPVELDQYVVELEPGERGQQMLDRRDRHAAMRERRAQRRRHDVAPRRSDVDSLLPATEMDAEIDRGRMEGHGDRRAGMETQATAPDRALERLLPCGARLVHRRHSDS